MLFFLPESQKFFLTFICLDMLLVLLKVLSLSDAPSGVGSRGVDVRTSTFFYAGHASSTAIPTSDILTSKQRYDLFYISFES